MHRFFNRHSYFLLLLIAIDLVFFSLANPHYGNALIVIIASGLIGCTLYVAFRAIFKIAGSVIHLSAATQKKLPLFITSCAIFILLLNSIGQLNGRDLIGAFILSGLLYFYSSYLRGAKSVSKMNRTGAERN